MYSALECINTLSISFRSIFINTYTNLLYMQLKKRRAKITLLLF